MAREKSATGCGCSSPSIFYILRSVCCSPAPSCRRIDMASSIQSRHSAVRRPSRRLDRPWVGYLLLAGALFLLEWALFEALKIAPTERTMGIYQRIFYVHVPAFMAG